ncbi:glycosyltransferase [Agromyces badenianii]|uniref:glycosyltransferase n=1 Tax=Agromyces badenianii TaxID=2080742 RepID=UPI000D595EE4|nr:glycosyltransferase family 2 protein [Agromyces badenianii]PWC04447.1 dTDP-Rha--alpha-D-GlcNAc-pyrophosphate polyprenol alpha-3-L-rhamnosyltransferase [Agromyces badenianii]
MRERIAVVTVSYGSDTALEPFLESVRGASSEPVDIVVFDNLPGVGRAAELAAAAGAQYLESGRNLGYGGAINAAVRSLPAAMKRIVISNPDVVFHAGSIDRLVAAMDSDERLASVGPSVHNVDGTVYPSARTIPSIRTGVGHALFASVWPSNPWTAAYHANEQTTVSRDAGWLSGSCLLVRREAFDGIQGFDEEFFMYFEDVDLGYRFGRSGWRNRYEPDATVTHTGGHSTAGSSEAMVKAHHRSAERFIAKKYSAPLLAPIRMALLCGLRVRSFLAVRRARSERRGTPS